MARVIVFHGGYGCDTGCCGHYVELTDDDGLIQDKFQFTHPYDDEDGISFAKDMVEDMFGAEHVADLDWDGCVIDYRC